MAQKLLYKQSGRHTLHTHTQRKKIHK